MSYRLTKQCPECNLMATLAFHLDGYTDGLYYECENGHRTPVDPSADDDTATLGS